MLLSVQFVKNVGAAKLTHNESFKENDSSITI